MRHPKAMFSRYVLVFMIMIGAIASISAQIYTTTGNSNDWDDPAAWTCTGPGCQSTPPFQLFDGTQVIINDSIYYDDHLVKVFEGAIIVSEGGKLVLDFSFYENEQAEEEAEGNEEEETFIFTLSILSDGSLVVDNGSVIIKGSPGKLNNAGVIDITSGFLQTKRKILNTGTINFNDACIKSIDGSLYNFGHVSGPDGSVNLLDGNLVHLGTWSADVSYCVEGFILGDPPGSENCVEAEEQCFCLETDCVIENPDIIPGINSVLKTDSIIGAELTALNEGLTEQNLKDDIFILGESGDVCIDIFVIDYQAVVNLLQNTYGISPAAYEPGSNTLAITVFFPISLLDELNTYPGIIQFVRPTPVGRTNNDIILNSSLPNQGDFAQESFFTRAGFGLSGKEIKVGVLSDSYDKSSVFGNQPASADVSGGVLPGDTTVGAKNPNPVQVLLDYPRSASDEGRGMLQIVHSVAPQAELYFHTAFISPNSFADGIRALRDAGCDIIVDDVTYITESFFGDGVVAEAVEDVTSPAGGGVEYITCAGNFASRAYQSVYTPSLNNRHDFSGGGDDLQELTLEPGDYLVVLQWQDDKYSVDGAPGALIDFDFYLADVNGNPIYGFNRDNLGGDPVEVLPFSVVSNSPTTTYLYIEQVSGPSAAGVPIQYVVFKAGGTGNSGFSGEYFTGGSTVVGHANNTSAMTVGAVRFSNTPAFGGTLQTESFSSTGDGAKPDFTAPNGGNVTINLGNDLASDSDNLPNFFGTSAAAPHAAGMAALLLESRTKFGVAFNLRDKFITTAIDYGEPASSQGAGFISAFDAASSFANPSPVITRLNTDSLIGDPNSGGTLVIEGEFLNDQTTVFFRDSILEPQPGGTDTSIIVDIPPFIGNPPIWVFNPALANGDGGADTAFLFEPIITPVQILSESKTKKFGEILPAFTFTTDLADLNQDSAALALLSNAIMFSTTATDTSSVGQYAITPTIDTALLDSTLLELYTFSIGPNGFLTIEPIPLLITPDSISVTYGEALPPITYTYTFGDSLNIPNRALIENMIEADHQSAIADDIAVLKNISLANISLANISLANRAFVTSYNSTLPNISLANISLANGMQIIEVDARLFEQTDTTNLVNGTNFISNISLANFISLANNQAYLNADTTGAPELNISLANISLANISLANFTILETLGNISLANISLANFISLANISLANISLANNVTTVDFTLPFRNFISLANSDNTDIVAILTPEDVNAGPDEPIPFVPVNFVSGLDAGEQVIIPAAFFSNQLSKNFFVEYAPNTLEILPAPLDVIVQDTAIFEGDSLPQFRTNVIGLQYDDMPEEIVNGFVVTDSMTGVDYDGSVGVYSVEPVIIPDTNYIINATPGLLEVEPALVVVQCPEDGDLGCNPAVLPGPAIADLVVANFCDAFASQVQVDSDIITNDTTGCLGTLQYRYTATDSCGQVVTCVQTLTYTVDHQAPVFSCIDSIDAGCNPVTIPGPEMGTAIDNCTGIVDVVSTLAESDTSGCFATLTYLYSASDACGNTSTCLQVITYTVDQTSPLVFCNGPNADLGCNPTDLPLPDLSQFFAIDNCGSSGEVAFVAADTVSHDTVDCTATLIYRYSAGDACGNIATCLQTFTYTVDVTPPVISCPAPIELGCNPAFPQPAGVTATDNCFGPVPVLSLLMSADTMDCTATVLYRYEAVDACGNAAACSQVITFSVDNAGPVFDQCPESENPGCNEKLCLDFDSIPAGTFVSNLQAGPVHVDIFAYAFGGQPANARIFNSSAPTGGDPDLGTPNVLYGGPGVSNDGFEPTNNKALGNLIIIDENSGSEPDDHAQGDSLVFVFSEPVFIGCLTLVDIENPTQNGAILAYDPDGQLIGDAFAIPNLGDNSQEDLCLNKLNVQRLVVAFDGSGAVDDICFYSLEKPLVTATDPCTQLPASVTCAESFFVDEAIGCTIATVERIWSSEGQCGSISTCHQTVSIVADYVAPEITCPEDVTVTCPGTLPPVALTDVIAFDDCTDQGDISVSYVGDIGAASCPDGGMVRRIYQAMDTCGNTALCAQQITLAISAPIQPVVMLGGSISAGNAEMTSGLTPPENQPYGIPPFNYEGTENCGTISESVIDWILLELRDENDPSVIVRQKCGLLLTSGLIVAEDEVSPVVFDVPSGQYYLAVRHRNHLGVMTANAMPLSDLENFNFATAPPGDIHMGSSAVAVVDGVNMMIPGDVNQNGIINIADLSVLIPFASVGYTDMYDPKDVNLDGVINIVDLTMLVPFASVGHVETLPH